tara:strand:- start:384 stop:863 length:480 start_codon:yes stop_codon:yes gene_type:complete
MVKSSRKPAAKEKPTPMDVVKPSGVVKSSRKRPELTVVKPAPAHTKRPGGNRGAEAAAKRGSALAFTLRRPGPNDVVNSKFNTFHLKKRRSTRPIKPKANKSARVQAETAAVAAFKSADVQRVVAEKRRLLTKLLTRHKAAGRMEAAAETQAQLDELAM